MMFTFASSVVFGSVLLAAPAPAPIDYLIHMLEKGSPGERVIAAESLGELGPAAEKAIPALTRAALGTVLERHIENEDLGKTEPNLADVYLFHACLDALDRIGPKSTPAFIKLLEHEGGGASDALGRLRGERLNNPKAIRAVARCLSSDDFVSTVAAWTLAELGPAAEPAIPELVAAFRRYCHPKDIGAVVLSPDYPIPSQHRAPFLNALLKIGPRAAPAIRKEIVPLILAEMKNGYSESSEWDVVGEAGAAIVPVLVKKARSIPAGRSSGYLIAPLPWLGIEGRKAAAALMNDPDAELRGGVIGGLRSAPARIVAPLTPQLLRALKDHDVRIRLSAAKALGQLGPSAPPEVAAALFKLLTDSAAATAIEKRGFGIDDIPFSLAALGSEGIRMLAKALRSPDPRVRLEVVTALGFHRDRSRTVLAELRDLVVSDSDPRVALAAASAAYHISLDEADLRPVSRRGFTRDTKARETALVWIINHRLPNCRDEFLPRQGGGLGPIPETVNRDMEPKVTMAQLIDQLTDPSERTRIDAALGLAAIGPLAKSARPSLRWLLTEPGPDMRLAATYALARIEDDLPAYRERLARLIRITSSEKGLSVVAERLIEELAPDFPEVLPLSVPDPRWSWFENERIIRAYGKAGPKGRVLVPLLRNMLDKSYEPAKVCEALGALGPTARDAVPDLRRYLDHPDLAVAVAARNAIRKIERGR